MGGGGGSPPSEQMEHPFVDEAFPVFQRDVGLARSAGLLLCFSTPRCKRRGDLGKKLACPVTLPQGKAPYWV